jgi:hypothetical protein
LQEQTGEAGFRVDVKTNFLDAAQQNGGALQGFAASDKHHQQNYVEDLNLTFATPDDWVRFSVRQSQSTYAADADYLRMLASQNKNRNSPGRERFLFHEGTEGTAGLQRIDVNVLKSDWLGASVFASHRDVDAYYESLASQKSKDEFAASNRSGNTGGGKVNFGPVSLTASYTVLGGSTSIASPTETRQDRVVAIDLTDLRKRLGESAPSLLWAVAPSTIYAGNFSKQTSYDNLGGGLPDLTNGISAGASWTWNNGTASVGYWNYFLNSQRFGEASYDSSGRGLDANIGVYGSALGYYGGISYRRSDELAPLSRAFNSSYDTYSSITYKSKTAFPDLIWGGAWGRYQYASPLYNISDDASYWSAAVGFDFTKFLSGSAAATANFAQGAGIGALSLKAFYRYTSESDRGSLSQSHSDDHFFGLTFRAGAENSGLPLLRRWRAADEAQGGPNWGGPQIRR